MISKILLQNSIQAIHALSQMNVYHFTAKDLKFDVEARDKMLKGAYKLAQAVKITYGPKGRNVIIDQSFQNPKITKDGVTVAKAIDLKDNDENVGATLIKEVASKTNDEAGDGTTCATVLAYNIFAEGNKSIAAGMNPMDLKKGIQMATDAIVEELKKMSQEVKEFDQIVDVATISANGDKKLGKMIAEMIQKVGKYGNINVQEGKTLKHETEFIEGMSFDRGYNSPYFINDSKGQKCVLDNPKILLTDAKINNIQQILHIVESVARQGQALLIISEELDGEALATILLNKLKGSFKCCAVKPPSFGDNRKSIMDDIALLTQGKFVCEEAGILLSQSKPEEILGTCKKVIITKENTILMGGNAPKTAIDKRIEEIKDQLKLTPSGFDGEKLQERLAKLTNGIGIIKVGGASEVEVGEIKDRITDSINATKAAIDEGTVIGGGCALLYASRVLKNIKGENFDQNVGISIIERAIKIPVQAIADNAGYEGSVVRGKLELSEDHQQGFNAASGKYENLIKSGIIDPTKVIKTALIDASSIAGMMLTSSCLVLEKNKLPDIPGFPQQDKSQLNSLY